MISVVIIGQGNVATHLFKAFSKVPSIVVTQVNSRNLKNIPLVDITIIAISDDAIASVSSKINNPLVVHTSGSIAMESLKNPTRKGVFYMLQTFSKEKEVDFSKVPFCIEAENKKDLELLELLAKKIGEKIYPITSKERQYLHVAAVFANNFSNHMYKIANDICDTHQIPFEILHPLIIETGEKATQMPPKNAQTGPAIRNDKKTIQNHISLLDFEQQKIYKLLTKSIQNGEKL
ncbi:Rossmann-like and DUF2520 domain-containing protein [Tenacibaculum sp. UWU-22]|uniref:Rossmann-like and DUF2520 domain-containing protein n=1 Tax=Tenacibaculum sp. UWU-22 TaxID=3234187 RepID=UPI0034DAD905